MTSITYLAISSLLKFLARRTLLEKLLALTMRLMLRLLFLSRDYLLATSLLIVPRIGDSRCGALMLPWTAELCTDMLGKGVLYEAGESDED